MKKTGLHASAHLGRGVAMTTSTHAHFQLHTIFLSLSIFPAQHLFPFISVFLCVARSCLYSLHLLDHSFFSHLLASVSVLPPLLAPSHPLSTLPPLFHLRDDHYIVLVLKVRRFDPDTNEVSRNKSGTPTRRTFLQTFTSTHFLPLSRFVILLLSSASQK